MNHRLPDTGLLAASLLLLAALSTSWTPMATAQPISPDRPGLGTGATLVRSGAVQFEVGTPEVAHASLRVGTTDRDEWLVSVPGLLRLGLHPLVELRLSGSPYNALRTEQGDQTHMVRGYGDLTLGVKVAMPVNAPFFVTDIALLPTVTIPLGDAPFSSGRVGGGLHALGNWLGWWKTSLSTDSGIDLVPTGDNSYDLMGTFVLAVSHALPESVSIYAEGAYYPTENAGNPIYAGAGFTYAPAPFVQLDAFFDRGLNGAATDWLYGAGLAVRL